MVAMGVPLWGRVRWSSAVRTLADLGRCDRHANYEGLNQKHEQQKPKTRISDLLLPKQI